MKLVPVRYGWNGLNDLRIFDGNRNFNSSLYFFTYFNFLPAVLQKPLQAMYAIRGFRVQLLPAALYFACKRLAVGIVVQILNFCY
jgi:hypothetical protein